MNDPHETMFNEDVAYPIWAAKRDAEDLIEQEKTAALWKETEDKGLDPF